MTSKKNEPFSLVLLLFIALLVSLALAAASLSIETPPLVVCFLGIYY